jgi:hypothetical protein
MSRKASLSYSSSRPDRRPKSPRDIKRRLLEAFKPVLEIFDEASTSGLAIQRDNIKPVSPRYKHEVNGLRIIKYLICRRQNTYKHYGLRIEAPVVLRLSRSIWALAASFRA